MNSQLRKPSPNRRLNARKGLIKCVTEVCNLLLIIMQIIKGIISFFVTLCSCLIVC